MSSSANIQLDIGFAIFELHEDYLIATVKEGVLLGPVEMEKFHEVFDAHYANRPFGYISNRLHDYTIDPTYYRDIYKYDFHLVGIATLCYSLASYKNAKFAEKFLRWPHQAFYTLEECELWIAKRLAEHKKAGL